MLKLSEIESAIERLTPEELRVFRVWFTEYDAALWDRQFEEDVMAGRLDAVVDEALKERRDKRLLG